MRRPLQAAALTLSKSRLNYQCALAVVELRNDRCAAVRLEFVVVTPHPQPWEMVVPVAAGAAPETEHGLDSHHCPRPSLPLRGLTEGVEFLLVSEPPASLLDTVVVLIDGPVVGEDVDRHSEPFRPAASAEGILRRITTPIRRRCWSDVASVAFRSHSHVRSEQPHRACRCPGLGDDDPLTSATSTPHTNRSIRSVECRRIQSSRARDLVAASKAAPRIATVRFQPTNPGGPLPP